MIFCSGVNGQPFLRSVPVAAAAGLAAGARRRQRAVGGSNPELSNSPPSTPPVVHLSTHKSQTHALSCLFPGTVGLMTMPIMGTADGYTEEDALEPALALGVALQVTTLLQ